MLICLKNNRNRHSTTVCEQRRINPMLHQIYLRGKIKSERKEIIREDPPRSNIWLLQDDQFLFSRFLSEIVNIKTALQIGFISKNFSINGGLRWPWSIKWTKSHTRWKKFRITFGLSGFLGLELYHDDLTKLLKVFADVRVGGLPRDAEDDEVTSHFFAWNKNILTQC